MSIKKFTKSVYVNKSGSSVRETVIAASSSIGNTYELHRDTFQDSYSDGETQMTLPVFYNAYAGDWFYDTSHKYNFYDQFHVPNLGAKLYQWAMDLVTQGKGVSSTYLEYYSMRADLTSKNVRMFGNSDGGSWLIPDIMIGISDNRMHTTEKSVTVGFTLLLDKRTYDQNRGAWYGESGQYYQIMNGRFSGTSINGGLKSTADRIAARAKNIDVYLGCGLRVETIQGNIIRTVEQLSDYDNWFITVKGDPVWSNHGFSFVISLANRRAVIAGNWTTSTTDIDPVDPTIEPDPYDPVPDPPKPPGPDPDPTPIDDPIPIPGFPPVDGVSVGIYKAYRPSSSQLQQIASQLWDPSAWAAIKQMFDNPMESILGLAIIPVNPTVGASLNVYLGRYNTQVSVPVVASDYVTVDCGSVAIKKFYGSYLDHDPYTKYTIYLPYIGEMELNADEITGRVMNVVYHCNVITGDIVALVALDGRVCYTGMGNFIRQLPLSQTDYSSIIQTAVSAASVLLTTAVAGAGGAAVAGAAGAGSIAEVRAEARVASTVANGSSSLLSDVLNTKYNYKHSGKIGQGAGQIGVQKPFITINRPNLALPENNNISQQSNLKAYTGYPCNKIVQLSSCHGFTQIEACKLSVPGATDEEVAEIYSLLKGGVLL